MIYKLIATEKGIESTYIVEANGLKEALDSLRDCADHDWGQTRVKSRLLHNIEEPMLLATRALTVCLVVHEDGTEYGEIEGFIPRTGDTLQIARTSGYEPEYSVISVKSKIENGRTKHITVTIAEED